jgi:hypothetical protein
MGPSEEVSHDYWTSLSKILVISTTDINDFRSVKMNFIHKTLKVKSSLCLIN